MVNNVKEERLNLIIKHINATIVEQNNNLMVIAKEINKINQRLSNIEAQQGIAVKK